MKGIGLVFAGGGGKGSYEIGVWKYLHEVHLDEYIRVVSGTSVGALNAALFVGSSFELAEKLWIDIEPQKILTPKKIQVDDVLRYFSDEGINLDSIGSLGTAAALAISKTASGMLTISNKLLTQIYSDYLFSREGLIDLINDGLNFPQLKSSGIICYATCLQIPVLQIKRFTLNDYDDDDIIKLLLASSAIPIVFPNEEFYGDKYCDGGIPFVGDNVPIEPVYNTGVEFIFVVHLSQDAIIDKDKYPNAKIIEIIPSIDLGDMLTGTLDFTPNGAETRINQGYQDAKRILQPMVEMLMINAENQRILKLAKQHLDEFEEKKKILVEEEIVIKEEMKSDGFDELYKELMKEN